MRFRSVFQSSILTAARRSTLDARTAGVASKSSVIPEWCYRVSRGVAVYLVVAVAVHCTLFTAHCFSQPAPAFIAKQGQVRVGGQPANGEKSIVFRVYDAPSSGTKVWERNCTVYCINGMFNYPLSTDNSGGATNGKSIADLDFTTTQYYIAMSLDGGTNELMPREPIAAIPYAFAASTATCLRGNGHIKITGAGDHYIVNGNVGIGTTNPTALLAVSTGTVSTTTLFQIGNTTMTVLKNGFVGIGTTNPGINPAAGRTYLTLQGSGGDSGQTAGGVLQLGSCYAASANNGNIEWFDIGNTVSSSKRNAYITSGSVGSIVNNKGAFIAFGTKADGVSSSGVERLRIDSNGNVGIGTTNPGSDVGMAGGLTINGTASTQLTVQKSDSSGFALNVGFGSTGSWTMFDKASGAWVQSITSKGGYVGIGTTNPEAPLEIKCSYSGIRLKETVNNFWWNLFTEDSNGTFCLYANSVGLPNGVYLVRNPSGWTVNSDFRLKTDIVPIESILDKVIQLKPVWYRFKNSDSEKLNIGFIAQDVETLFPLLVNEGPVQKDGIRYKGLSYQDFGVLAIEAIKELKDQKDAEIKQLKAENDELKQKNREFEFRLEKLENK